MPTTNKAGRTRPTASGSNIGGHSKDAPSHDSAIDLSGISNLPLLVSVKDTQKRAEHQLSPSHPTGEARTSAERNSTSLAGRSEKSRDTLPDEHSNLQTPVLAAPTPVFASKPPGFSASRRRLDPSWAPKISISMLTHEESKAGTENVVYKPPKLSPSAYQPRAPSRLSDPFPSPTPGAPDARSQLPRWAREEYLNDRQAGVTRRGSVVDTSAEADQLETSEGSWPPQTNANMPTRLAGEEGTRHHYQTAERMRRSGSTRRSCFLPSCVRRRSAGWARQRPPMRHHILDSSSSGSSTSPRASSSSTRLPHFKSANPMRKSDWVKAVITVAVAVPIGLVIVPVVVGPYAAFKWGFKKGKKFIDSRKGNCSMKPPWSRR